jgi:ATP-binding cassette subfamily B protein
MQTILKFYKFIWHYKKIFLASIFCLWIGQIATNYSIFIFKDLIDSIEKHGFDYNALLRITLIFLAYKFIAMVFAALGNYFNDAYIAKASADLRIKVITHIHNLDFSYHTKKQSGALISIIKRGDAAFWGVDFELNRSVITLLIDYIFVLFAFWGINYKLSLIILVSVIINLIASKFIIEWNIKARRIFNDSEDYMSGLVVDNMINYETVKLFAQESWEQNRLKDKFTPWMKAFREYSNSFRLMEIITNLIALAGSAGTTLLAINMLGIKEISVGEFSLIIAFVLSFFPKLNWLTNEIRGIVKQLTDLDKYINLLDAVIEVKENPNAVEMKNVRGSILFDDVTFAYPGRQPILKNFNLAINNGESVALVGYSGAGKSTLMKLLLRFYDVTQGGIMIDKHDIRTVSKVSLRKSIGLVPQEPILFNDTIGFNIAYPRPEANLDEIKHAANLANLDQFIESLPEKYDTIVGERGIKLSGGQKQRLAIARMFLANPQIIVFDEATSQLDSESEQLIQEAFWRIAKNKTTLIIAHRLSTVMRADRIIVIDNGQIIEQGTHKDLISKESGLYKKLWDIQKGVMLN